jgi:hypothetical protein
MDFYNEYNINPDDFESGLPDEVMDTLKPKKQRRDVLVEDCYILSLADLGKGLLRPVNEDTEGFARPLDEQAVRQGKQGEAILTGRWGKLTLKYSVDLEESAMVNISGHYRNSLLVQDIGLDVGSISYGMRPYLLCPCGYRANKLYLSPRQYSFLCRRCAGLYYESTTINRSSTVGSLGYMLNRLLKLDEQKAKVKRVIYAGKYTKKADRIVKLFGQYAVASVVQKVKSGEFQV